MITWAVFGGHIRVCENGPSLYKNKIGTIVRDDGRIVSVLLEGKHSPVWFYFHEISYLSNNEYLEFKERQRRQAHADKYL